MKKELAKMIVEKPQGHSDQCSGSYQLDKNFSVFAGHFADYPVLPAFVQINMACYLLEEALGREARLAGIRIAKFTGQAKPGMRLDFLCTSLPAETGSIWECRILGTCGEDTATVPVATFRLFFN